MVQYLEEDEIMNISEMPVVSFFPLSMHKVTLQSVRDVDIEPYFADAISSSLQWDSSRSIWINRMWRE